MQPPRTESLRGAVREGSLEEAGQCPEEFDQMGNLLAETIKQPPLVGPMGLTSEGRGSPQLPAEASGLGVGEAWLP